MSESEQWQREQHDTGLLVARVLLGVLFIVMGVYKLSGIDELATWLGTQNVPLPTAAAWFAAIVETAGGIALAVGIFPGRVALLLALYLIPATLKFHGDINVDAQITHLIKNTGIIGGLIALWASRGGRLRLT